MLIPERMVRSMDRILHVSQDRIHPPEVRVLTAFGPAAFVPGSRSRDPCEGRKGPRPNGKNGLVLVVVAAAAQAFAYEEAAEDLNRQVDLL